MGHHRWLNGLSRRVRFGGLVFASFALAVCLITASQVASANEFTIGYLQLSKDSRYGKKRLYARFLGHALGRPYAGAKVALSEVKFHGAGLGLTFAIDRIRKRTAAALIPEIDALVAKGTHFFLADLPADVLVEVAQATKDKSLLLLNVSAADDRLRGADCARHLLHVIPSQAMLMDGLTQYLVARKWNQVLLLVGPEPADELIAAAFERSSKRYRLEIAERREFLLSNDPRDRDKNNLDLLTAGIDYDVVMVADADGEFARDVPYSTQLPAPIIGGEGLAPVAWHWSWDRHGAPQLENRFEEAAKRPMGSVDWAAWMAVKSIAEAVQRTNSREFDELRAYLLGEDAILDGFKGNRSSFRPWNNQLRQPVLLATHNWVVDRAPIEGFLHRTNTLDTLGFDEPESQCQF